MIIIFVHFETVLRQISTWEQEEGAILTLLCLGGMFEPESRSYRVYTRKAHRPLLPFLLNYPPSEYDFSPFILLFDVPHTHAYAYITKKMERKNIFSTFLSKKKKATLSRTFRPF